MTVGTAIFLSALMLSMVVLAYYRPEEKGPLEFAKSLTVFGRMLLLLGLLVWLLFMAAVWIKH